MINEDIISKDKKEIHWIGLPTESKKPYDEYKKEKQLRLERIKKKKENLAELMAQQVSPNTINTTHFNIAEDIF